MIWRRLLSDMGKALDWLTGLAAERRWQVTRVNAGPGINFIVCLHPDTLRVITKSGTLNPSILNPH